MCVSEWRISMSNRIACIDASKEEQEAGNEQLQEHSWSLVVLGCEALVNILWLGWSCEEFGATEWRPGGIFAYRDSMHQVREVRPPHETYRPQSPSIKVFPNPPPLPPRPSISSTKRFLLTESTKLETWFSSKAHKKYWSGGGGKFKVCFDQRDLSSASGFRLWIAASIPAVSNLLFFAYDCPDAFGSWFRDPRFWFEEVLWRWR